MLISVVNNQAVSLTIWETDDFRKDGNWKIPLSLSKMELYDNKDDNAVIYLKKLNALLDNEVTDTERKLCMHLSWNCLLPNVMCVQIHGDVLETLGNFFNETIHATVEINFHTLEKQPLPTSQPGPTIRPRRNEYEKIVKEKYCVKSRTNEMPVKLPSKFGLPKANERKGDTDQTCLENEPCCQDTKVRMPEKISKIWKDYNDQDEYAFSHLSSANANILSRKLNTDTVIVASNGSTHPCHSCFLSVNSAVLAAMLNSDGKFKESKEGRIELPDVSEDCIKAVLEYFYIFKITSGRKCSKLAVELFRFAHKYDIGHLEKQLAGILLQRNGSWYDVNAALELFSFTRCIDEYSDLKLKSVQVIQLNAEELLASDHYQTLFTQDVTTAMELCAIAINPSFKQLCKQCQKMVDETNNENLPVDDKNANQANDNIYIRFDNIFDDNDDMRPSWVLNQTSVLRT